MAASIESRVPFLDDHVVEHVAALPGELKLRGWQTKAVLRAAVKDLIPPSILTRQKMGFPVPVGRWLREQFRPIVDEFVLGPRAQARGFFDPAALRRLADEHRAGWARTAIVSGCSSTSKSGIASSARANGPPTSCRPSRRVASVSTMRILWVKMGGLWPSNTGGRVRSLQIISELSRRHQVTVVTTHGSGDDPEGLARQLPRCRQVRSIPYVVPKRGDRAFPAGGRAIVAVRRSRGPVEVARAGSARRTWTASSRSAASDVCVADFLFAAANVPFGGPYAGRAVRAQRRIPDLEALERDRALTAGAARCSRSSGGR